MTGVQCTGDPPEGPTNPNLRPIRQALSVCPQKGAGRELCTGQSQGGSGLSPPVIGRTEHAVGGNRKRRFCHVCFAEGGEVDTAQRSQVSV